MTMFGLSVCLYITISVCLRFDVRGELTVDVVYSLLSSRLENLELETHSIKTSMTNIDDRIDQIEMLIKSQLPTNTHVIEVSEGRNEKVEVKQMNQAKEKILNAFASEKLFIRNALSEYEEQFTELRKTVNDQMNLMNKSIEASNENLERKIEETEANLNQFKTNSDIELQEVIIEFETAMNNTATEHETTVSKVNDVRNTVQNIENDQNSQDRTIRSLESKHSGKISSLESRVSTLHNSQASDISSVRSRVNSLEDKRVGFTAKLSKHLSKYAKDKIIVFDDIKTSYGGGYSSSTGIFTAPKSGLYLFQFNVEALSSQKVHASLYVNGNFKTEAIVNNGPNFTGSNAAVAYMNAGQQSYIKTANLKASSYGIAGYRTSFTGVLIN